MPRIDSGRIPGGEYVTMRQNRVSYSYDVVERDQSTDVALIKIKSPGAFSNILADNKSTVGKLALSKPGGAQRGTKVISCGFPFNIPEPVVTYGRIATATVSAGDVGIGGPRRETDVQLLDMHINGGDSGCPISSRTDGTIVGLADAYLSAPGVPGLAVMVPASSIRHIMAKHGIKID